MTPSNLDNEITVKQQAVRDLFAAALLIVISVILFINARGIPLSPYEPIGPRFLAEFVPGLIIVLAIILVARNLKRIRAASNVDTKNSSIVLPALVRRLAVFYGISTPLKVGIQARSMLFSRGWWSAAYSSAPNAGIRAFLVLLLLMVYAIVLQAKFPYVVCTAGFISAASVVLSPEISVRKTLLIGCVAITVAVLVHSIFTDVLVVALP